MGAEIRGLNVTFVVGTTASGKSDWALAQSSYLQNIGHKVAILNCDSVQRYQGLLIGSASPSRVEQTLIPHFLYNEIVYPLQETAAEYRRRCLEVLEKLNSELYSHVYIVGGTGFYFQALEKGLYAVPPKNQEFQDSLQQELLKEGGREKLHSLLAEKDPEAARRISPMDDYRLLRALDIIHSSGKSLTEIEEEHAKQTQNAFPYPYKKIGIKKPEGELKQRILERTDKMFAMGWLDEVDQFVQGQKSDWRALQSVGYKDLLKYLQTPISQRPSVELLKDQIVRATWQLARKQRTWFQRDSEIQWNAESLL